MAFLAVGIQLLLMGMEVVWMLEVVQGKKVMVLWMDLVEREVILMKHHHPLIQVISLGVVLLMS